MAMYNKNNNKNTNYKIIAVLSLFISISLALPVSAAPSERTEYYKVTAPAGLNLRNEDCSIIATLPLGTLIEKYKSQNVTPFLDTECDIKGTKKRLTYVIYIPDSIGAKSRDKSKIEPSPVSFGGFLSIEFIRPIESYGQITSKDGLNLEPQDRVDHFEVDATSGLNLRDENCKLIRTLPHKTKVYRSARLNPNNIRCTVRGVQYSMTSFGENNGKVNGYLATLYLK